MEYQKIQEASLVKGLNEEEIRLILNCLQGKERQYEKGEVIFHEGELIEEIGIVLSGKVIVERNDYWGNRFIIAMIGEMEVFGETYACLQKKADLQVIAAEKSRILFLDVNRVIRTCSSACPFHSRLICNLLETCAQKNYQFSEKMDILSRKTTREKLLEYLSRQASRQGSQQFVIPLNRQQLADYLSVDRSAMTVELGRLRKEGLIDFEKNCFTLR